VEHLAGDFQHPSYDWYYNNTQTNQDLNINGAEYNERREPAASTMNSRRSGIMKKVRID
jgi:hypothetical protein